MEIGKRDKFSFIAVCPSVVGPGNAYLMRVKMLIYLSRWTQFEWNMAVTPFSLQLNQKYKTFNKSYIMGWGEPVIISWLIIVSLLCADTWVTYVWSIDCIRARILLRLSPEGHCDHRGPPQVTAFCKVIMGCTARCNLSTSSYRQWGVMAALL